MPYQAGICQSREILLSSPYAVLLVKLQNSASYHQRPENKIKYKSHSKQNNRKQHTFKPLTFYFYPLNAIDVSMLSSLNMTIKILKGNFLYNFASTKWTFLHLKVKLKLLIKQPNIYLIHFCNFYPVWGQHDRAGVVLAKVRTALQVIGCQSKQKIGSCANIQLSPWVEGNLTRINR